MKRTLLLFLLIASLAAAQTKPSQSSSQQGQLTIEAIFAEGGITGRAPETIKWSPDGTKVSFVQRDDSGEHGALYYVDVATGKKAVLVAEEKLASLEPPLSSIKDEREKERIQRYSVAGYQWAPDSKHLLFDSKGQLWLYSLDSGTAVQLTSSSDPSSDPKFTKDGKHVAFVRKHNLWIKSIGEGGERQLTTDKDENLLNGEVDWVYAEELDVRSNYFLSPNGKEIVFLQMNETKVPSYPIVDWLPQHPRTDQEKYPKAGDPNPEVRVGVIGAGGGKVKWLEVGKPEDREYIPRFGWVRDGMIWIQLLNRAQSKLDLYFVDVTSGKSQRMLSETSDAWVPVTDMFQILDSGDRFLWPSWRDGFMQLYLYSFDKSNPLAGEAKLERQLTKGDLATPEFEVESLEGIDEDGNVYLVANASNSGNTLNREGLRLLDETVDAMQRQLFKVNLNGERGMQQVSHERGTHGISMPDSAKYYVDTFSSLTTPARLSVCKLDGTCTAFWQARAVQQYSLPAPRALELKAADGKTTLYGTLLLPPQDVISAHGGKVPLINNPYGGPGSQSVVDKWGGSNYLFDVVLSRAGFAILHVDNRGMAGRGREFTAAIKHHFGDTELADQLAAIDQVLRVYPVLDGNRLGWWGWSYGGYMTTYALTHTTRFKAGIAVAPVTDWKDYDSIYTERYMGLPNENSVGYKESSTVLSAERLNGRLLLVHGTGDDNVHMQNTMQFIQSLITANKPYDLQLYPRKTHGIAGKAARVHLFHRLQDQFELWLMSGGVSSSLKREVPRDETSCRTQGGRWGRIGFSPNPICNLRTHDNGKPCRDSTECEGICLATGMLSNFGTGQCSEWTSNVGCLSFMEDGRPHSICID